MSEQKVKIITVDANGKEVETIEPPTGKLKLYKKIDPKEIEAKIKELQKKPVVE